MWRLKFFGMVSPLKVPWKTKEFLFVTKDGMPLNANVEATNACVLSEYLFIQVLIQLSWPKSMRCWSSMLTCADFQRQYTKCAR